MGQLGMETTMVCGYEENVILTVENRTSEGLQEEHFVEVPLTGPGNGSRHVPINVEDYIFRGGELEDYSIYELAMVTYSRGVDRATVERYHQRNHTSGRAGLWNRRVFFQAEHSQANSRWTVFQKQEKVPCVIGTPFKPT